MVRVKSHKRTRKNGVSVVRQHLRSQQKYNKKTKKYEADPELSNEKLTKLRNGVFTSTITKKQKQLKLLKKMKDGKYSPDSVTSNPKTGLARAAIIQALPTSYKGMVGAGHHIYGNKWSKTHTRTGMSLGKSPKSDSKKPKSKLSGYRNISSYGMS